MMGVDAKSGIRKLIDERGMTVEEFAEYVGILPETLRSILYRNLSDYKVSTMMKISIACGVTVNEIVMG